MPIQFQCPNISTDPTGQPRPCGKQLRAPDSKAGKTAKCPKCGSKIKIPAAKRSGTKSPPTAAAWPNDADQSPDISVSQDEFDDPVLDGAARPGAIDQRQPIKDQHPFNPRTENFVPVDQTPRCRKCGKKTDKRGYCSKCNYASVARDDSDRDLSDIKIRTAGFQLWMSNIISEGVPVVLVSSMMHFLAVVFVVFGLFVVFTAATGLMFYIGIAFFAAIGFFYTAWAYKCYSFRHDPQAQLAWFQRPFWDIVLWSCRKNGWKDGKSKDRVVIDQRQTPLTDQLLDKLPGLKNAQVVDLEGTLVTDEAFRYFYRMDRLQCLVLKETEVSHEAVFRLQQAKPKVWIWY